MRSCIAVLALALLATGCGSTESRRDRSAQAGPGTLKALWQEPGENVGLVNGTSDYAPGRVRFSFLVITKEGRAVFRPRARVFVASGLQAKPFTRAQARLEQVGVPGASDYAPDEVTQLYVARVDVPRPGKYWVLAEPVGGEPVQALGNLVVKRRTASPAVGSKAFPSRTPTLASAGGDLSKLTTRDPPDTELLRHSIAGSLADRAPFVAVFATPKFCTSRTCGPVVDVVDAVRKRFRTSEIRFIHVEIYENNDPGQGLNRFVREWRLPSEPWVFLVGRDGRIDAKFEGSVSVPELEAAVRRHLA